VWNAQNGEEILRNEYSAEPHTIMSEDEEKILIWRNFFEMAPHIQYIGKKDVVIGPRIDRFRGATFSRDGKRVLMWSDSHAHLWDSENGESISFFAEPPSEKEKEFGDLHKFMSYLGVRFSHDETRILTWSVDGLVRVWNAESGVQISQFTHGNRVVGGAVFAGNDRSVLSWADGITSEIVFWDAATGDEIVRSKSKFFFEDAVFSRDGTRVMCRSLRAGKIVIWNINTGEDIAVFNHKNVVSAKFSDDESLILSRSYKRAILWNVETGAEVSSVTTSDPLFIEIEKYSLSYDEALYGKSRRFPRLSGYGMRDAVFSSDEEHVLSWNADGKVFFWKAKTGEIVSTQDHEFGVLGAELSPDDIQVLSWAYDGTARLWSAETGDEIARRFHSADPQLGMGAKFIEEGNRILSWGANGSAEIWDVELAKPVTTIRHDQDDVKERNVSTQAVISPDSKAVLSWGPDGVASIWDLEERRFLGSQSHGGGVFGGLFAPNSKHVLTWGADGIARVWNAVNGEEVATQSHGASVSGAVFSEDSKVVVSWGLDKLVKVWNAETGSVIAKLVYKDKPQRDYNDAFGNRAMGAALSPDGQFVVSWDSHQNTTIWSANTSEVFSSWFDVGHTRGVAFSSDSKLLFQWGSQRFSYLRRVPQGHFFRRTHGIGQFSNADDRILFWHGRDRLAFVEDTNSGKTLLVIRFDAEPLGVVFSSDSDRILSWDDRGSVQVTNSFTGAVVARFEHSMAALGAAFSSDDQRIISWDRNGRIAVWDATSGAVIQEFDHTTPLTRTVTAALSANDRYIVSAGGYLDTRVNVWRMLPYKSEPLLSLARKKKSSLYLIASECTRYSLPSHACLPSKEVEASIARQ